MLPPGAVAACLAVAALWGISPIAQKMLLQSLSVTFVFAFGGMMYFAGIVAFAAFHQSEMLQGFSALRPRHIALFFVATVLGALIANLLWVFNLKNYNSVAVTAITSCFPLVTALLAWVLLKERLGVTGMAGLLLIVAGVACISLDRPSTATFMVPAPE